MSFPVSVLQIKRCCSRAGLIADWPVLFTAKVEAFNTMGWRQVTRRRKSSAAVRQHERGVLLHVLFSPAAGYLSYFCIFTFLFFWIHNMFALRWPRRWYWSTFHRASNNSEMHFTHCHKCRLGGCEGEKVRGQLSGYRVCSVSCGGMKTAWIRW